MSFMTVPSQKEAVAYTERTARRGMALRLGDVYKRQGFTCEGTVRRARTLADGGYADEIRYSLLREEYRPQPAPK